MPCKDDHADVNDGGRSGAPPDISRRSNQQKAGGMRGRSVPGNRRRLLKVGSPIGLQHYDQRDTESQRGCQSRNGRNTDHFTALVALAAMGSADSRFAGGFWMVAVKVSHCRSRDLRQCHGCHRAPRMTSQQGMRPQQRDDREDRKLGTQAPAAVSVHGEPENTRLDE